MPDMPDSGIFFWVIAFPMVVLPKIRAWYPCCRTAQAELARWRPVWSRSSMVKRCQKHPPTESFWRHLFSPCLAAAWGLWTMFSDYCSHIFSVQKSSDLKLLKKLHCQRWKMYLRRAKNFYWRCLQCGTFLSRCSNLELVSLRHPPST